MLAPETADHLIFEARENAAHVSIAVALELEAGGEPASPARVAVFIAAALLDAPCDNREIVKLAAALRPHVELAMMEPEVREKVEENADGHS